ncbi:MAG TPA: 30S ribosome-binding factor RbfA [Oscillospiraceae bacterium]|nr:30S ribosome-binding factor RbfA [Oscillospiraceae bacterium]HNW04095.1 30S ribosome-binding factor RbfA [Oscillospiraceae bacterium]HPV99593.1 30S ribosome-binding factor RbfA [Oscillospiraceae bacterium]
MAGYKLNRMSEDIRRELMDILRNMKDPRLSGGMLSIVRIELSGDASSCKVYLSALEGLDAAKAAVKVLKNAQGFIRKELSGRLDLRKSPELRFIADDSIAHSADIEKILRQIGEE